MKFDTLSNDNPHQHLNWNSINAYVSRYKPHTSFEVSITRRQAKVSDPMRKYYFAAVLPPFMDELGYDPDEQELFHRQLKIVFFKCEKDKRGIYRNVPSVFGNDSEMPMDEKVKYLEWVCRKASQAGVYIEPAQEV